MSDDATPQEGQHFLLPSIRGTILWLFMFYVLSYLCVRFVFEEQGRTLLVGPAYSETLFDGNSSFETMVYYIYKPIGVCDEALTGRAYELDDSFFNKLLR